MPKTLIEIKGLSKTYHEGGQEHIILQSLDAEIHHGEILVLLGRRRLRKIDIIESYQRYRYPHQRRYHH